VVAVVGELSDLGPVEEIIIIGRLLAAALRSIRLSTWPFGLLAKETVRSRSSSIATEARRPAPS
jgi:hypothetical protein